MYLPTIAILTGSLDGVPFICTVRPTVKVELSEIELELPHDCQMAALLLHN